MKRLFSLLIAVAAAGCATPTFGPMETCHVCRYNNDLACVCVQVDASTPRTEYQGHTYYFCSEDCRAAFLKQPAKYVPRPNP